MLALISTGIVKLVTIVGPELYNLVKDAGIDVVQVGKEVEKLEINLRAIKAELADAEKRRLKDDAVSSWLEDIKDVSYDMDSVLDEWITQMEKSEFKRDKGAYCFGFMRGNNNVVHRYGVAQKIKDINNKIDNIITAKARFNFRIADDGGNYDDYDHTSTSFLDVHVYGQDRNKSTLVDRLTSSDDDDEVRFIPIFGMGGIGKTTLAKTIYNHDEVSGRFEGRRMWICVSNEFNISRIACEIIKGVEGGGTRSNGDVNVLLQKIRESIQDKKFLIVLDDVWTDDYEEWGKLERALRLAGTGSRIVVTTRKEEVARMVGEREKISVEKLADEDCWSLMREIAFWGKTEAEKQDLEETGKEIARKCKGLPLTARTLGGVLHVKKSKSEWLNVLRSELWELEKVEKHVFRPLLLSYFDLSLLERSCFSYCGLFPKGHEFHRDDLVQQWMAQFQSKGGQEAERIGGNCFDSLATKSFFQDFQYSDVANACIKSCKMHDIVHDFARYLTSNEISTASVRSDVRNRLDLVGRHANISISDHEHHDSFSILNPPRLHSLIFSSPPIKLLSDSSLSEYKSLRALTLIRDSDFDLPSCIGKLIHLRYLCLIAFGFHIKLPSAIGELFNLQTMKIVASVEFPKELENLANLRNLYAPCAKLGAWPKSIWKMTNLRAVERLIPDHRREEAFQLRELRILNQLTSLHVKELGADQRQVEGAKEAQLSNKTSLVDLVLHFHTDVDDANTHTSVLQALEPHQSLRSLVISNYGGRSFPPWVITLTNLEMLILKTCLYCETLPSLGALPSLKFLALSHLTGLKRLGPEFLAINDVVSVAISFPNLKHLVVEEAPSLREWVGVPGRGRDIMPRLEELSITWCERLESLPDFLWEKPLKKLVIEGCPAMAPPAANIVQNSSSQEWKMKYLARLWVGSGYSNKSLCKSVAFSFYFYFLFYFKFP